MKYLTTAKTSADILATAAEVWRQYVAPMIPVVNGVVFENVHKLGACQQNIRELIGATVYGEEWRWPEARCCAGTTCRAIKNAGYPRIVFEVMRPGDLVYMAGGKKCKTCGGAVGHTGMYLTDNEMHRPVLWQNTSADGLGLCERPMSNDQIGRINGIFRLLPLAEVAAVDEDVKTVWLPTGQLLTGVQTRWAGDKIVGNVRELAEGIAELVVAWQQEAGQTLQGIRIHAEHLADQDKLYLEPY